MRNMKMWCIFCVYYESSLYGRTEPNCSNHLAFDANLTPCQNSAWSEAYFMIWVKGQIKHSAALWCSFTGKSLCLTLKHTYFPFSPPTQCTLPLI